MSARGSTGMAKVATSLLLSLTMALGGVPAPALAEMAAEAGEAAGAPTTNEGTDADVRNGIGREEDLSPTRGLGKAVVTLRSNRLVWSGRPVTVDASVETVDGSALTYGTDYELAYYAQDGTELASAPTSPGSYQVSARGVAGGAWVGETAPATFEIAVPEAHELALGVTELDIAAGEAWVGRVSAVGDYRVVAAANPGVIATAYADAALANPLTSANEAGELSLAVAQDAPVWVTLAQPEGAATHATLDLAAIPTKVATETEQGTANNAPQATEEANAPSDVQPQNATEQSVPLTPQSASDSVVDAMTSGKEVKLAAQSSFASAQFNESEYLYYDFSLYKPVFLDKSGTCYPKPKVMSARAPSTEWVTLVEGQDYDLSYETVDAGARIFKCVVTGKDEFAGYQSSIEYKVVTSVSLQDYVQYMLDTDYNGGISISCGPNTARYSGGYNGEERLYRTYYRGYSFVPYVYFSNTKANLVQGDLVQGVGFDVEVRDSNGASCTSIVGAGNYSIKLTAREGSSFYGTAELPTLKVEAHYDISGAFNYSFLPAAFISEGDYTSMTRYYLSEKINGLDPLNLIGLHSSVAMPSGLMDRLLVENVDYTVKRTSGTDGEGRAYVDVSMKGIGLFDGEVTYRFYGADRQRMFDMRNPLVNDIRVDSSGVLQVPNVYGGDLRFGVDCVLDGFQNAEGTPITTAKAGDEVYVRIKGIGIYDGCTRVVKGTVAASPALSNDLASEGVGVAVTNGSLKYERQADGKYSYSLFLRKGLEPTVAVSVYSRGVVLREGDGFTVSKSISPDGSYMDVTTVASGDSMVTGTKTTRVTLVEKYSPNPSTRYDIAWPTGEESHVYPGMAQVPSVGYDGTPLVPNIKSSKALGEGENIWKRNPDVELVRIIGPDGNERQAIDGVGRYVLELGGTGEWEFSESIPIDVYPRQGGIYLENCDLVVPDVCALSNGQARPAVTVTNPATGKVYQQGVDYDVSYGSNNEAGKRGWVKVTARQGNTSGLVGSKAASFLVTGPEAKATFGMRGQNLMDYRIEIANPEGNGFYYAGPDHTTDAQFGMGRVHKIFEGGKATPQVRVLRPDGTVLPTSEYVVSYENNDRTGMATARVSGRGSYAGEVTTNFYVSVSESSISPVTTTHGGTDWSAVYDPEFYAARNPDVANWARRADGSVDGNKLLQHFVDNGRKEGRASKQSFELASYYNANADLRRAFGTDWARYYDHYRANGAREGRAAMGVGALRGAVTSRDGVDWAPVYDALSYAAKNPDVARWATRSFSSGSVLDDAALLSHFVGNGTKECRSGKEGFDVRSYYNANPDLRAAFAGTADWSRYYKHYATNGARENRKCAGTDELQGTVTKLSGTDWSPVYDRATYGQRNSDVTSWATRKCGSATVLDDYAMLSHFASNGRKEGRASKATFELASYYNANADLRRAFGGDWARYYDHYRANGQREGRTATGVGQLRNAVTTLENVNWAPAYDANFYAERNSDVANWARRSFSSGSVIDDAALLSHFVNSGTKEARASKAGFDVRAYKSKNADLARTFGNDWKSYYRHYAKFGVNEHRACV